MINQSTQSAMASVRVGRHHGSLDALVTVSYLSSSNVMAGIVVATAALTLGNPAILSGLLFDGDAPVVGATATVNIIPQIDISARAAINATDWAPKVQ